MEPLTIRSGDTLQSQPLDNMDDLVKQLQGLRSDLKIEPPVIVRFSLYGDNDNTITINVTDDEK